MIVKCFSCGTQIEKTVNSLFVEHGRTKYYCAACMANVVARKEVFKLCDEIFGYHVINTRLEQNLRDIAAAYSYEDIDKFLVCNKNELYDKLNNPIQPFKNELHKINYFTVVVKNTIADYIQEQVDNTPQVRIAPEFYETKYTPRQRRRTLAEFEGDITSEHS